MASIYQTLEMIRFPVSVMRRVKVDAIVAPIAIAGKLGDGHQLDMGDAKVSQVIEPVNRRQKRSLRCKSADMKFIKYGRSEWLRLPESVRPWERAVIHSARWSVNSAGLPGRAGIRKRITAINHKRIIDARSLQRYFSEPPAVFAGGHAEEGATNFYFDLFRIRCPNSE